MPAPSSSSGPSASSVPSAPSPDQPSGKSGPSEVRRRRDLLVTDVPASRLVIACDAVGGIGPRPDDSYPADPVLCAHMAARVPLLEVLCARARPTVLINTLCQDSSSAAPMIAEFRRCAVDAGIDSRAVTGSTEDNVATTQTGIGVTVIGTLPSGASLPTALPGDAVVCLGAPISAPDDEVHLSRPEIVELAEVRRVLASGLAHDALPVGSGGIAAEAAQMAATAGLRFRPSPTDVDMTHSGGPATCVLVACRPGDVQTVCELVAPKRPRWTVGTLVSP